MKKQNEKAAQAAVEMAAEMLSMSHDKNAVYASNPSVPVWANDHYANMASNEYGAEDLIAQILRDNGAVFPASIGDTEFRAAAIGASMFASEIIAKIEAAFTAGTKRHGYFSVHSFLSQEMAKKKDGAKNKVGRIYLTNQEDKPRPSRKPRIKWFLIQ